SPNAGAASSDQAASSRITRRTFRPPHSTRLVSMLGVAVAILSLSHPLRGQEPPPALPSGDLLRAAPFARLTLIAGRVWIIDPVSPRPLPVYDPAKERERRKRATENTTSQLLEVGAPDEPRKAEPPEKKKQQEALEEIRIHLLQPGTAEVRDYKVK